MTRLLGWMGSRGAPHALQAALNSVASDQGATAHTLVSVQRSGFSAFLSGAVGNHFVGEAGSVAAAFVGRPLPSSRDAGMSNEELLSILIARFCDVGADVLDELTGSFALAIFDADRKRGFIAADRMGVHSIFTLETAGGIAFGSAPTQVLALAGESTRIDTQAVFNYLYCHVVPAPLAICEGPRRLLPGEAVVVDGDCATVRRYWQAKFREHASSDFDQLKAEFLQALRASVTDAMHGARCGAFLSGGTDSSTIAGLMTEVAREPVPTFSIGFDASGYDEMEYARLAARHFGTEHHEYYVTPNDIVEAVPKLASSQTQPFGNSSALPTYLCARLARDRGVDRLLGGDGGDELFGGNTRYAKQYVFSLYETIPAALRRAVLEPGCRALEKYRRLPAIGKFVSYIEQASLPMPQRLETYNLLQRIGFAEVLTPEALAQIDVTEPARLNRDAYFNPSASSLINRMLALDFKTTLADNDLQKVMQSCELAGLPVAFPMLDARVVDFSLSLSPHLKLNGTRLRYFFKEALRGFLPDHIIRKKKHGFGLPFGQWAVSHPPLRELTFDTLNSLKSRQWVRPAFIDRLKDELLPSHANYYGTLAFVLMMLELWLQRHYDSTLTRTQ